MRHPQLRLLGHAMAPSAQATTLSATSQRQGNCRNFICGVCFQMASLTGNCSSRMTGSVAVSTILAAPPACFLHAT